MSSLAVMGYTHQCNGFLREERMSWIASLLCCGPQDRELGIFSIGRHCDKGPESPYERSDTPQVSWWIGLPLGQALVDCPSSLGG